MNLEQASQRILKCAELMDKAYKQVVFDEWAIVSFMERTGKILSYIGPRRDDFQKNFAADIKGLRVELLDNTHGVGDFEFARHGVGTGVEAFMIIGMGLYLICNNTTKSMDDITKDPLWLGAQVPFVELSDEFRSDRVMLSE
jgi:hypothetical protein